MATGFLLLSIGLTGSGVIGIIETTLKLIG